MSTINNAIAAYSAVAKNPLDEATKPAVTPVTDFAAVLKDAAKVAVGTMREAEQTQAAAIAGKADIREVVAAITNAEATLETVVTVRDKVIHAYNEILRMPI